MRWARVFALSAFTALQAGSAVFAAPLSETKLTASDAKAFHYFGRSLAIDGDTIVVGAWGDSGGGLRSGAAYVFERNQGGADSWGEVKKLTASDAEQDDRFGDSVAISGDTIAIGADGGGGGAYPGAVYVFERNQGGAESWGEVKKLAASDAEDGDRFGLSVAISGDTLIAGAWGDGELDPPAGAAYVFDRSQGGDESWGEVKKLSASDADAGDFFGWFLAISGDTIVIGADGDGELGLYSGAAYVFERDQGGADSWGQVKKLAGLDQGPFDHFGWSVAISGDTIVVGRHGDDELGHKSGSAYLFERDQGGADSWGQVKKLSASDADAGDFFGWSVAIDAERAVAGARLDEDAAFQAGSAYLFERDQGGAESWGQAEKLRASDAAEGDGLGWSAAISGDTIAVGTHAGADAGYYSGSAYVYAPSIQLLPTMPLWGLSFLSATLLLAGTVVARAWQRPSTRRPLWSG